MATAEPLPAWQHTTVLLVEAVDALLTDRAGTYVDATFGRGGHARRVLDSLADGGRLIAFDRDPEAVAAAREGGARIDDARFSIRHARFARMAEELAAQDIVAVDGVLLDLGVSSRRSTTPRAVSASASTARWTCAWTRPAARAQRTSWRVPANGRLRR